MFQSPVIRRRVSPLLAPALIMIMGGVVGASTIAAPQDAGQAARRADLPAGVDIVREAVEAMGGRDAYDAMESIHVSVTRRAGAQDQRIDTYMLGDDKLLIRQLFPQLGFEVTVARNGDIAWAESAMTGLETIGIEQVVGMAGTSGLSSLLRVFQIEETYGTIETLEHLNFQGEDCYKLRLSDPKKKLPNNRGSEFTMFFSERTGLPVAGQTSVGGRVVGRYESWAHFGDLYLFTEIKSRSRGKEETITYDEIELNSVDETVFELPPSLGAGIGPDPLTADPRPVEVQPGVQPAVQPLLPPAEVVIRNAVDAIGGAGALAAVKSIQFEVSVRGQRGEVTYDVFAALPEKFLVKQRRASDRVSVSAMNGAFAWRTSPSMKSRRVPAGQVAHARDLALAPLLVRLLAGEYKTITTVDRIRIEGKDCYKVKLYDRTFHYAGGSYAAHYAYFDVDSARLVAFEGDPGKTEGVRATTYYRDWKRFGDLMLASRITSSSTGSEQTRLIRNVTFNEVDDAVFAIPEVVAATPAPAGSPATSRPAGARGPGGKPGIGTGAPGSKKPGGGN